MSSQKFVQLIAKLTRLTSEGKLQWSKKRPPGFLTHASEKSIMSYYECEVDDRIWGLHEERYEEWDGEADSFRWKTRIILALYDDDGDQEYALPSRLPGLSELYETVRYRASKVGDVIENILKTVPTVRGKKGT